MGIGVKFWLSQTTAIDGGAGWSFWDPDGFQRHGDFLFHKFDLFHVEKGEWLRLVRISEFGFPSGFDLRASDLAWKPDFSQ